MKTGLIALILCAVALVAWANNLTGVPFEQARPTRAVGTDKTLCVLGDTQDYVNENICDPNDWAASTCGNATHDIYDSMWDYAQGAGNCAAVIQVGDVINAADPNGYDDDPNQFAGHAEWIRAMVKIDETIAADIPVIIARGNHDSYAGFYWFLGPQTHNWVQYDWYVGHNDLGCSDGRDASWEDPNTAPFHNCDDTWGIRVDMGGWHLLLFALSCGADSNEHLWIKNQLAAFPNDPFGIVEHIHPFNLANGGAGGDPTCAEENGDPDILASLITPYKGRYLGGFSGHDFKSYARLEGPTIGAEASPIDLNVPTDHRKAWLDVHPNTQNAIFGTGSGFSSNPQGLEITGGRGFMALVRLDPSREYLDFDIYSDWDGGQTLWENLGSNFVDSGLTGSANNLIFANRINRKWFPQNRFGYNRFNLGRTAEALGSQTWDHIDELPASGITSDTYLSVDGDDAFKSTNAVFDVGATVTENFFIGAWVRGTWSGVECILGSMTQTQAVMQWGFLANADGTLTFKYGNRSISTVATYNDGEWHQLLATHSATNPDKPWRMWVDRTDDRLNVNDSSGTFTYGRFAVGACVQNHGLDTYQNFFTGDIDNIVFGNDELYFPFNYQPFMSDTDTDQHQAFITDCFGCEWDETKRNADMRTNVSHRKIDAWWPLGATGDTTDLLKDEKGSLDLARD